MEWEVVANCANSLLPADAEGSKGYHRVFAVLQTQRVRGAVQDVLVDLDRRNAVFQFVDHPIEGDVAQAGLCLWIASANVAMAAREPDLLQPLRLSIFGLNRGRLGCPSDPWKVSTVFVDRHGVTGVLDIGINHLS